MDYTERALNPLTVDITVTNLPQSAETKSRVAIRMEKLENKYMAVRNGPSTLISSYHICPPRFLDFDITSTTTSSQIIEIINNKLHLKPCFVSKLASKIFHKANDMDLDRNAITMDVLITNAYITICLDNLGLETESCSICLESLKQGSEMVPIRMACSHVFHDGCIYQWLRRKNSCPLCRGVCRNIEDWFGQDV